MKNTLTKLFRFLFFTILNKKNKFPIISLSKVIKFESCELIEITDIAGGLTIQELVSVIALGSNYKNGNFLEIGSFRGRTSINLSKNYKNMNIYTLDLPSDFFDKNKLQYNLVESDKKQAYDTNRGFFFKKYPELTSKVKNLYGDSAIYDFKKYSDFFDFILIDGSHKYENVIMDTENSLKMIKNKGCILWHDYSADHLDVVKALNYIVAKYGLNIYRIKHTKFAIYINNDQ